VNSGKTIFAQLMKYLPSFQFQQCVDRYNGNYKVINFKCSDQFRCMAFAQLTYRESLRDIEACLRVQKSKLYHMGIWSSVSRNNLSHANETRDWRIYADFAQVLIRIARELYADDDFGLELKQAVYAFDSTTIDLCLALFPWAKFRKTKSAVKLHTLLDLRGNIPVVISITNGKINDVNALDDLIFEVGAIYIFDRGYVDFSRLYRIHQARAFFVTRANTQFRFQPYFLPARRKRDRDTIRPNHHGQRLLYATGLSREAQENQLPRCQNEKAVRLFDQQLHIAGDRHRGTLQMPLAGGIVLQMDQATSADQGILRHQRERGEDSSLDRDFRVRSRRNCQEKIKFGSESLHNFTDFECDTIRKNAHFAGVFFISLQN
jgi:hypothetical protein